LHFSRIKKVGFVKILEIINHIFKPPPAFRHTRPLLSHGSESWVMS
jgi:hypothetical protein